MLKSINNITLENQKPYVRLNQNKGNRMEFAQTKMGQKIKKTQLQ